MQEETFAIVFILQPFFLGFMAKKESMPFMQFISPYLVIIADQRFFLAKMKNPPHRERGATKLDCVLV
jgi:hypothetical protein